MQYPTYVLSALTPTLGMGAHQKEGSVSAFDLARVEVSRFTRRPLLRVAVVVVALIPLLYGALYLWSSWDPYSKIDELPVALVNLDQPVVSEGEELHVGRDVADELLDSHDLGWSEVTADEAAEGLANGTYYQALTIPADFSAAVSSAASDSPVRATLYVSSNEASSMLASQIGDRVMAEIRSAVSASVSEETLKSIFIGVSDAQHGYADAAQGAASLNTGLRDASSGASLVAGGATAASTGATALTAGLGDLNDGAGKLDAGVEKLVSGAGLLASKSSELTDGASQVAEGVGQAQAGTAAAAGAASSIAAGTSKVGSELQAYLAAHPEAMSDPHFATALAVANSVAGGATTLAQGLGSSASGMADLKAGSDGVASGAKALSAGVQSLAAGAAAASEGSRALSSGARAALDGSAELTDGLASLSDGAARLDKGIALATDGSAELESGLEDGATAVPSYTDDEAASRAAIMSQPVELDETVVGEVPNYGTGFAPYFIPLALWVGALVVFFLFRPLPAATAGSSRSPFALALGGYLPGAAIAAVQALLLYAVVHLALGLAPVAPVALCAFIVLIALVFAAILQWLNVGFGPAGKLLALVLLMLQLSSAAGTFPIELMPPFFQAIHPFMPMSYAVAGLRQAISGGNMAALAGNAAVLALFGGVAFLGTSVTAVRAKKWTADRLRPSLEL